MERRDFLKMAALGTAAVGLGSFALPAFGANAPIKLTILHTNDTHSRIDPFPSDGSRNSGMGGLAQRAALVKQIRAEGNHVLLLDAGDIFQGTAYYNFFGGEIEYKAMSSMGYDAVTLGNHDFDSGLEGIIRQLPNASFEFLCANYEFANADLKTRVKPYKIFQKGPLRIGVFGLGIALQGLVLENLYTGTKYFDPIARAKEMVQELKAKHCQLIVCLSHLGNEYDSGRVSDKVLAQSVSGIDLIIGGHTHTFMDAPTEYIAPDGNKVLVNQVGWAGINMGRIDYVFSKSLKESAVTGQALGIGATQIGKM